MIPQAVLVLILRAALWSACLWFTYNVVTDGAIEKAAEDVRGRVSDKTIWRFRVGMYGFGYTLAVIAAALLADTLRRIWFAWQ